MLIQDPILLIPTIYTIYTIVRSRNIKKVLADKTPHMQNKGATQLKT